MNVPDLKEVVVGSSGAGAHTRVFRVLWCVLLDRSGWPPESVTHTSPRSFIGALPVVSAVAHSEEVGKLTSVGLVLHKFTRVWASGLCTVRTGPPVEAQTGSRVSVPRPPVLPLLEDVECFDGEADVLHMRCESGNVVPTDGESDLVESPTSIGVEFGVLVVPHCGIAPIVPPVVGNDVVDGLFEGDLFL